VRRTHARLHPAGWKLDRLAQLFDAFKKLGLGGHSHATRAAHKKRFITNAP